MRVAVGGRPHAPLIESRETQPVRRERKDGRAGMRILVIEDEIKMARAIRRGLEQESYAVDVAADGDAGLRAALARDPDAVILDLMLPGLDGFEVVRELRSRGRW